MKKWRDAIFPLILVLIVFFAGYLYNKRLNYKLEEIYTTAYYSYVNDLEYIDSMKIPNTDTSIIAQIKEVNRKMNRVYSNGKILDVYLRAGSISSVPEEMSLVLLEVERQYEQENKISQKEYQKYIKIKEYVHKTLLNIDNETLRNYNKINEKVREKFRSSGNYTMEIYQLLDR